MRKLRFTDGTASYFVKTGIAHDDPDHNYHVFKCLPGHNPHGYTGRGNPWTTEAAAEKNLVVLAKKHNWHLM